jgi:hypothetical protein
MDSVDPSSASATVTSRSSELAPVRADTSGEWAAKTWISDLDAFVIYGVAGLIDNYVHLRKQRVHVLGERVTNNTWFCPKAFNTSGRKIIEVDDINTGEFAQVWVNALSDEISTPRHNEVTELISVFLENVQTEETLERCELAISDIIDSYGKNGIAALEAQLLESAALEPLFWRFLTALGARRGDPTDQLAKQILLRHLNSSSAGRRAAATSALGAFSDGALLNDLERRAAVEKNRMVIATLNAHIRALKRDAVSAPKIL